MTSPGPYLVRVEETWVARPPDPEPRARQSSLLQRVLIAVGVACLGFYAYTLANQYVYQAFENWAFDQQITGRPQVSFADYLRETTPFGFLVRAPEAQPAETASVSQQPPSMRVRPDPGALLGRIDIPRLALSAIVREGVDAATLSRAVGHVPSTVLAGARGNFAIAAHRDTLFRALKDIRQGDVVTFESPSERFTYEVFATRIVKPSEVSVLRPDGGWRGSAAAPMMNVTTRPDHLLTMITCYPFYYVGSAPERFIVQARLISSAPISPHRA